MCSFQRLLFFIFLFFLLKNSVTSHRDNCPISRCGEISIQYPFSINAKDNNNHGNDFFSKGCVYPRGFGGLSCRNGTKTILKLPSYGEFDVQGISYTTQEIQLSDPGGCLPRRFLHHNQGYSGFSSYEYQANSFIFYNCSTEGYSNLTRKYANESTSVFYAIDCLSSLTRVILAIDYWDDTTIRHSMKKSKCKKIETVIALAPLEWPPYSEVFYPLKVKILSLKWYIHEDEEPPKDDLSKGIIYSLIIVGSALPILIGIAWCCCRNDDQNHQTQTELSTAGLLLQQSSPARSGLDETTIQSYPQVVLCQSRKFLNPENITCSICLADYTPKDTLKSIPECNHYFHVNCIDEWLRVNGSCPVCRKSPLQSSLAVPPAQTC
ncbi:putative RING-H2 finger protein ATL21A [Papaver somniferum]|uniref:putative RING-H2 finger protein ATL21A n=1 Tax=Papaver somniferum TaxID=3469 RepID=UPI000E705845|nr:putative RING-H2 finger protein ATL21A [Papaver somniferum]